jgi:hypothetical protein
MVSVTIWKNVRRDGGNYEKEVDYSGQLIGLGVCGNEGGERWPVAVVMKDSGFLTFAELHETQVNNPAIDFKL